MSTSCPACAQPATGRFCSECGAALAGSCRNCAATLVPGARFCNGCGTAVGMVTPGQGRSWLPWSVAAVSVAVIAGALALQRGGSDAGAATAFPPAPATTPMPGGSAPATVDLSAMTPREAADRLFDRVMRAESAGDMDEVLSFTPMAIQAYGRVDDLDADARYHLGLLHLLLGETDPARTYAEEILAEDASHLFGLFVAAQAARAEGREVEARELYARFLDAYPTEITRDLPEYQAHANVFPTKRAEALEFTR